MFAAAKLSVGFMTRREQTVYFLLILCRALAALLDVAGIFLIGIVASVAAGQLDSSTAGGPVTILGFELPAINAQTLVWLVVIVLALFVSKALISILLIRRMSTFIAGVEVRNARKIASFLLNGSFESAKRYSKAEFQYAVGVSSNWAFTGILNNVASIISEGFLLLVIAGAFVFVDPLAAAFAFVYFAALLVVMQYFLGRLLKRAGEDAAAGLVGASDAVGDTLDTFREISVLAKQDLFVERISSTRARLARSGAVVAFLGGMPRYLIETALILGVVLLVGSQLLSGNLTEGLATIGVFLTGGVRIMASILPLQSALATLKVNAEQSALAHDLLRQARAFSAHTVTVPADADVDRDRALGVSVRDAVYRYEGDEHDTIKGVSFDIAPGSYAAIIGPSGAGKTTLVDLLLGLVTPRDGSVEIGGLHPDELRAIAPGLVSYVPQRPGLVSGTIGENIALGVPPEEIDADLLREVAEAAYLSEFIATLPAGFDTSVGKQADALSGGQIQRIGLARALYARPRLLILDEATSGLDAATEAFVSETLAKLHGAVTVVVIAHRLSTVQHADDVMVIEDGRVIASGDFPTVRKTVPTVAEYVRLMSFSEQESA